MIRAATPLLVALALAGCATSNPRPYQSQVTDSEALSVMQAGGFHGLKDAELPEGAVAPAEGGPTLLGGLTYSLLGNGLLGFVSWMSVDDSNPAGTSRVVAWIPQSLAPTEAQAEELTLRLVKEALVSAARSELTAPFSLHEEDGFTLIKGGACDAKYARCWVGAYKAVKDSRTAAFDDVKAPDFLGGAPAFIKRQNKAYEWGAGGRSKGRLFETPKYMLDIHGFEIALKASAQLPEWVYLYAAPGSLSYQDKDARKMLPFPVVFHQGKALYFLKPAAGAAVAVK